MEECKEIGIELPPYAKAVPVQRQFSVLQSEDTATVAKFLSATTPEEQSERSRGHVNVLWILSEDMVAKQQEFLITKHMERDGGNGFIDFIIALHEFGGVRDAQAKLAKGKRD